jgi:hypothetical protein
MGCQRSIAEKVINRGADYLVTLKANQGTIFAPVREHREQSCFALGAGGQPVYDAFDDTHGRTVRRRVFACPEAAQSSGIATSPATQLQMQHRRFSRFPWTGKSCSLRR